MIYTLTMNPSLDYVCKVEDIKLGEVNRTSNEAIFAGGKGINVSTILQRLGVETKSLGFLAGFTGQEIEKRTHEIGLKTNFIYVHKGLSRINIKLKSKEETEVNGNGPNINEEALQQLFTMVSALEENDILILAGSIPPSVSTSLYKEIMHHLREKKIRVIVDATGDTLEKTLAEEPFLIKPNIHELAEIINKPLTNKKEIEEAARQLQKQGARNVLVSCGGDGALLVCETGECYYQNAPLGKVINSTGAGDSMVAGFVYGFIQNQDYQEALLWGTICGSATAFALDLATKEEMEAIYQILRGERV